MKNQFLKRLKGIIALAVASLMFLQTGLMATALEEGNDYQYNCAYVGDLECSGSQLLYNGENYGFLFFDCSGGTSMSLSDKRANDWYRKDCSSTVYGYEKVIEGGTNLEIYFYIAASSVAESGSKYAKFVVAAGDLVTDASILATESGSMLLNPLFSVSQQSGAHILVAPLGESGHKYVWGNYGGETVTMNALPNCEFLTAQSGSGTQTDPYVFGIELTEVYRLVDNFSHDGAICNEDASGDTYIIPDTLVEVGHRWYASGAVLDHYEIQKYATPADVEAHYNDTDYFTSLSYADINYTLTDNGYKASFVMPKGHIVFNTITHEEMLADSKRVAKYTVKAKAATCTKSGNIEYVKCPSCEKIYAKEGDTFVEKTIQQVTIPAKGHNYKTVVEPATKNKAGVSYNQCVNCRDTKNKTTIYRPVVSLKKTAFTYNGKKQVPTVVVKDTKGKTISKSYYTVKYSNKNSKSIGTYKASVVLNTKYKGTIDLTYTIAPGKITLTKGDVTKNTIAVTWKKSSGATGYEVQYSTDKNFTKGKTKTATVKDKLTYKASKLTGNKTYYLRARSYTTVKNKKVYSDWSTTLKVKTSKK